MPPSLPNPLTRPRLIAPDRDDRRPANAGAAADQAGLLTVGIYTALGSWDGFLFPLVLTHPSWCAS